MIDLIEALTIMSRHGNPHNPTHCEHDLLTVCVDPALFDADELERLDALGFFPGEEGCFQSFRFGSA